MTFEKVEVNTWKPVADNEAVEGIFVKAESGVGANNSALYHVEVDGKPVAIWGSAVLDPKMNAVKPGDLIKIVYLGKGEAKGGHNAAKLFDVYIDYEHRDKLMAQAEAAAPVTEVPAEVPATPVAEVPTEAPATPEAPASAA